MRLLYLVPSVNQAGGVEKVLAVKTNYFIQNFKYEVHIITQNKGFQKPFFDFNTHIVWHDIIQEGSFFKRIVAYKNQLRSLITQVQPSVIIVADNGLKGYMLPYLIENNVPIIFESHGSKYLQESSLLIPIMSSLWLHFQNVIKKCCSKKYAVFVVLNKASALEWKLNNAVIISNPLTIDLTTTAPLNSQKVVAISRDSYEKGLDRLLIIWAKVIQKYPNWELNIYGVNSPDKNLIPLVKKLGISNAVQLYPPVLEVSNVLSSASIFVMTSRSEGMGMVLLEAMASGLPSVAYDCPIGPRSLITNGVDGFLIEDDNEAHFVQQLSLLIEDENLRKKIGANAVHIQSKYNLDTIMLQWKTLFIRLQKA